MGVLPPQVYYSTWDTVHPATRAVAGHGPQDVHFYFMLCWHLPEELAEQLMQIARINPEKQVRGGCRPPGPPAGSALKRAQEVSRCECFGEGAWYSTDSFFCFAGVINADVGAAGGTERV